MFSKQLVFYDRSSTYKLEINYIGVPPLDSNKHQTSGKCIQTSKPNTHSSSPNGVPDSGEPLDGDISLWIAHKDLGVNSMSHQSGISIYSDQHHRISKRNRASVGREERI